MGTVATVPYEGRFFEGDGYIVQRTAVRCY